MLDMNTHKYTIINKLLHIQYHLINLDIFGKATTFTKKKIVNNIVTDDSFKQSNTFFGDVIINIIFFFLVTHAGCLQVVIEGSDHCRKNVRILGNVLFCNVATFRSHMNHQC